MDSLMVWNSLMDFQRTQSQKEGQEDQGTLRQPGDSPLALPGPPGLLALGSLDIHQAIPRHQAIPILRPKCGQCILGISEGF